MSIPKLETIALFESTQPAYTISTKAPWASILDPAAQGPSGPRLKWLSQKDDMIEIHSTRLDLTFSNANNPWYTGKVDDVAVTDADWAGVFCLPKSISSPLRISVGDLYSKFDFKANLENSQTTVAKLLGFLSAATASLSYDETRFNGLWLTPGLWPSTSVRLTFTVDHTDDIEQRILDCVQTEIGAKIELNLSASKPLLLCLRQTTIYETPPGSDKVMPKMHSYTAELIFPVKGLNLILTHDSLAGTSVAVVPSESSPPSADGIIADLKAVLVGASGLDRVSVPSEDSATGASNDWFAQARLWYLRIQARSSQPTLRWQLGVLCTYAREHNTSPAPWIGLTYDSGTSTFEGSLLVGSRVDDSKALRSFGFDSVTSVPRECRMDSLSLWSLCRSGSDPPPQWLPTNVTAGELSYMSGRDVSSIKFGIRISSLPSTQPSGYGLSGCSWTSLVSRTLLTVGSGSTNLDIEVRATLHLAESNEPNSDTTTLSAAVNYSTDGSWSMSCEVEDLEMKYFARFFDDEGLGSVARRLLGQAVVRDFDVNYTFTKGQSASFCVCGVLQIGELELDLVYQYASAALDTQSAAEVKLGLKDAVRAKDSTNSAWSFEATLGSSTQTATLASCLNSLHEGLADDLPDFVRNIHIDTANGTNPAIKLCFTRTEQNMMLLMLWVSIADFHLTFVQAVTKTDPGVPIKRLLRVSASPFELADGVPLVNQLRQPFDELVYIYVNEDFGTGGMSADDMHAINTALGDFDIPLLLSSSVAESTIAIKTGHNFQILEAGRVLLDHGFMPRTPAENNSVANNKILESPPERAPLSKNTIPCVAISALSIQYKSGALHFQLDGTFKLGPLSLSLIGFEIVLNFNSMSMDKLLEAAENIHVDLHGAGLSLSRPPLLLAGALKHENIILPGVEKEIYAGGIAVGLKAWKFIAVGEYSKTITPSGSSSSIFIFAKLDGPLLNLEFGTISGVRLGFGYNSRIRAPTFADLAQCPFVGDNINGQSLDNPAVLLSEMTTAKQGSEPWVSQKDKEMWFLMGMTITAFAILTVTAVAIFDFSDQEVKISLVADAVGQMPPAIENDVGEAMTLFYIELLILATVNIRAGSFIAFAVLGSKSHVYVPQCRLHGEAFLAIWSAPSPHEGDFVLSVGGYHRDYKAPVHYNPGLRRIGMSCLVGDAISISGEAYFALTPKSVMAGGELLILLDVGPVRASAQFVMDVFINFAPFHYAADISLSIHCHANIDIGITNFDIDVDIRCELHIEGPKPFRGRAYVDFYIFAFHIDFGDDEKPVEPPLPLSRMVKLVQASNPAQAGRSSNAEESKQGPLKIAATDGLSTLTTPAPPLQAGAVNASTVDKPWFVIPGAFAFRISTEFAVSSVTVTGTQLVKYRSPWPVHCKPMRLSDSENIISELEVTIRKHAYNSDGSEAQPIEIHGFSAIPLFSKMPSSLWTKYDKDEDPSLHMSPESMRDGTSNATVSLCSGVQITRPTPTLTPSSIDDFVPLSLDIARIDAEPYHDEPSRTPNPHDLHDSDIQSLSVEQRYSALGADWLKQLVSVYGDSDKNGSDNGSGDDNGGSRSDGSNGNGNEAAERAQKTSDILTSIEKAMGWSRGKNELSLTLAPPKRYLSGFAQTRLALPIVVNAVS